MCVCVCVYVCLYTYMHALHDIHTVHATFVFNAGIHALPALFYIIQNRADCKSPITKNKHKDARTHAHIHTHSHLHL